MLLTGAVLANLESDSGERDSKTGLRSAVFGAEVTTISQSGEDIPVIVRIGVRQVTVLAFTVDGVVASEVVAFKARASELSPPAGVEVACGGEA